MTEKPKARVHVVIEGRVQGVFFRASTRDEARARGLAGLGAESARRPGGGPLRRRPSDY